MNERLVRFGQSRWAVILWSFALFFLCYALNTRHNGFPFFYHPDEPGKVEQVMTGEWNFNHPMLLLSTTKLAVEALHVPADPQAIVETGRGVSAVFTAVAVVAFSLLALLWRGWGAALTVGGALALHHQLYELAHYMKEDAALLMGVALTLLAAFVYWQRRSDWSAAALGVASALATSGKYVGALALVFAVIAFLKAPGERSKRHVVWWAATLLITLAVVNAPLLADTETFQRSLNKEMDYVVHGQRGMTQQVPHALYWNVFRDNTTPAMWVLLLVGLVGWYGRRKSLNALEKAIIAAPFIYAAALSFSPKENDRYFLPATALFTLLAALGCLELARQQWRRWSPQTVLAVASGVLILSQLPSWFRYEYAFQNDDTQELITWLRTEAPSTAVIAKDNRVMLPNPEKKKDAWRVGVVPQKVIGERFAADIGTLEELRAMGVTHVAVSESDFGRFFRKSLKPKKGEEESFERRKAFYTTLRREGELVFERDRGTVIYLHPGILVYRIAQPSAQPGPVTSGGRERLRPI